jgi:hypothetical protein
MNEAPILNLDGYLLSLRRLSGNKSDFWAEIVNIEGDAEKSLRCQMKNSGIELKEKELVGYREIESFLENQLAEKLNVDDSSMVKLFAWDMVELIQQSFMEAEQDKDPIYLKESFIMQAMSKFHGSYYYFVVPVNDKAILVGLANRA